MRDIYPHRYKNLFRSYLNENHVSHACYTILMEVLILYVELNKAIDTYV